jgi:glycosyltransferase involved in cell wall biosynthesis
VSVPRLSICIATLNRAAFIGATLESILPQATDGVEVLVLDGGSTDGTPVIVGALAERFPQLHYVRQEAPGGVDQDYDRSVELARGRYCWLMSDDDLLKAGAVAAVLEQLERGYALILVNGEVRDASLTKVLDANRVNVDRDRVYGPADTDRLFVDTAWYLTFIGCVVIERALWMSRERRRYHGSRFIHVGIIFQEALPRPALVMAEPRIVMRFGNASWSAHMFEIWMFKWPDIVWSFPGISEAAKRAICPREPWRRAKTLLIYRARGAYSATEYRRWLEPRLQSGWRRLLARAIARLPGTPVNVLALLYYSLVYRHAKGVNLAVLDNQFHYRRLFERPAARGS